MIGINIKSGNETIFHKTNIRYDKYSYKGGVSYLNFKMTDRLDSLNRLFHQSIHNADCNDIYHRKSSRKRKRKTEDQIQLLQIEFENDPE